MKRSDELHRRIQENANLLLLTESPGYSNLIERLELMEWQSLQRLKRVPAENTAEIVEYQIAAKVVDTFKNVIAGAQAQIVVDRDEIEKIRDGFAEDFDVDEQEATWRRFSNLGGPAEKRAKFKWWRFPR